MQWRDSLQNKTYEMLLLVVATSVPTNSPFRVNRRCGEHATSCSIGWHDHFEGGGVSDVLRVYILGCQRRPLWYLLVTLTC